MFEERLERVEKALRNIDHGTYGTCEICGGPIEKEVLAITRSSNFVKIAKKLPRYVIFNKSR